MYLHSEYCVSSRNHIGLQRHVWFIYDHTGATKELKSNAIVRDSSRRKIYSLTFLSRPNVNAKRFYCLFFSVRVPRKVQQLRIVDISSIVCPPLFSKHLPFKKVSLTLFSCCKNLTSITQFCLFAFLFFYFCTKFCTYIVYSERYLIIFITV